MITGKTTAHQSNLLHFMKERKMKRLVVFLMVVFAFGVVRASAQDVRYDFDKDKDFSKYKTYKWVPIKGADQPDELTAKQVTAAIDSELATKGLTKTDADTADLY